MQIVTPSRLPLQRLPASAGCPWARRVRTKPPVVCVAGRVQRSCQLAAAAVLSSAALQCAVALEPALCASVAAVSSPPAGHTLAVKRALLEDLLMQEVGSRLKSMSDADLVTVLEQVHQGRFQLPAAGSSLGKSQPSPDTLPDAGPPSGSKINSSESPHVRALSERQSPSILPGSNSAIQDAQQGVQQDLPATATPTGKQDAQQPDAKPVPDAWQQQTDRLQAFTKPLMQRLQGVASPQVSQPDAGSVLATGQIHREGFQPDLEQQTQSGQPQPSQPQPSQPQSSQPESSSPASAQQQSGARAQQEGVGSPSGPVVRDQLSSAQGGPAEDTAAAAGQAVSSEELTSSETGMQSVNGRKGDYEGPAGAQASSSDGTGSLDGQPASDAGQSVDEAEDATTRMLESAGVLVPPSAQDRLTEPGAINQPGRDISVREYLGFVWQRTQPQLVLLVMASSINTLAGTVAQVTAAKARQQAAALPTRHEDQPVSQVSGDSRQQIRGAGRQRLAALSQAAWQGLSSWVRKKRRGAREDEPAQAASASSSPELQGGTAPRNGSDTHEGLSGLHRDAGIGGNGKDHVQQEDEWGRPIVQMPVASVDGVQQRQVPGVGQAAEDAPSKVLWVRNDPEDGDSSNSSTVLDSQPDSQTILWQRGSARNHAAEQADGVPRRFRRSRLGRHEVSIESLLDNVE